MSSGDPSRPATPRRAPSYIQFAPKRAMQSFENLVALANHQERLREARRIVWRDRGEPVHEVTDVWECFEHAGRGALRAAAMAFNIRAGVNVFLLLFRIKKVPRHLRFALVRHAVFGPDTFRFSAMLGSFVYLYKFLLNALPLFFPPPSPVQSPSSSGLTTSLPGLRPHLNQPSHHSLAMSHSTAEESRRPTPRLALSERAKLMVVRKKTRRWHAIVAGAVAGGVAVLFEKRGRRSTIGQQMFVRGLQGSWNSFSTKHGITIPYGAVWVFALSCGQIMYACLLRPDTMPRSYVNWILQASMVPREAFDINRSLARDGILDPAIVDRLIHRKNTTPSNRHYLMSLVQNAVATPPSFPPHQGPCQAIHNWRDSCIAVQPERFWQVFRFMFPVYGALHVIPAVLFKRAKFVKKPAKVLIRALLGTVRSSSFLGVFVVIFQACMCAKMNLHTFFRARPKGAPLQPPRLLVDALIHKFSYWALGFLSGLSLFLEEPRRRAELTMYVLPKALESGWVAARGKGFVRGGGSAGEAALTAIGMGMVMATYQNDPQHLSGLVRKIIYQFIGPN